MTAPSKRSAVVARAEALALDVRLEAVRKWKAAAEGRRAVGCLPVFAPREVVAAAGALPVAIFGGGDVEVVRGDACFQSYICRLPRSVVELGMNGAYDALDGMVFPSTCDVIRNLSGMWSMLFPGKYVRYFDPPQNRDPALGGEFLARDLRSLAEEIGRLTGTPPADERLRASLDAYNKNRAVLDRLAAARVEAPWNVPTSELHLLVRAGAVLPVEEHTKLLTDYEDAVGAEPNKPQDFARTALRGAFCEQPPPDLIRALEVAGCYVVDDDLLLGMRWIDGDVPLDGDPYANLARAFCERARPCPSMFLPEGFRGDALVEAAARSGAEGVIFAAPSFCDPALLEQPLVMERVRRAGIPSTAFQYSENTGQFQTIREQAGTFSDSIRLA